jgi:hypothetical protein
MMKKPALFVLLIAFVIAACGGNVGRQQTLLATLITVDATKDAFVAFDRAHQDAIVDAATSKDEAKAKVAEWRKTQQRIASLFEAAYDALHAAVVASDDQSLASMEKAVAAALQAVADAKKAAGSQ